MTLVGWLTVDLLQTYARLPLVKYCGEAKEPISLSARLLFFGSRLPKEQHHSEEYFKLTACLASPACLPACLSAPCSATTED